VAVVDRAAGRRGERCARRDTGGRSDWGIFGQESVGGRERRALLLDANSNQGGHRESIGRSDLIGGTQPDAHSELDAHTEPDIHNGPNARNERDAHTAPDVHTRLGSHTEPVGYSESDSDVGCFGLA
jgi:hypothetical protein